MNRYMGLILLLAVLLTAAPAIAYEAWQPASAEDIMIDTEEYRDILDRFTVALERAATAQAAHPQFLIDLLQFQAEFAALLGLQQEDGSGYSSVASVPSVAGTWDILANTSRHTLVIDQSGSSLTGTIFGEPLTDARIEPDGSIYFVRPGPRQVYTGTLSTNAQGQMVFKGTFDCPVTGGNGVNWEAVLR